MYQAEWTSKGRDAQIPLLQSAQTGKFRPIKGTTEFTVKAKSKDFDDSTLKEITEKHIGSQKCE